ncbi:hypothetical protein ABI061_15165, partial [Enterococcus faecium]|uniref:hypothetical protein n=1 Tax=Enterococcus faecium TaxID=1352 RepID=UPI003F444B82
PGTPSTVVVICEYGNKLMAEHKSKDAIAILEQVFKRQPDYETGRSRLSQAYDKYAQQCKSPEEALANYHRAVALAPGSKSASQNLDKSL